MSQQINLFNPVFLKKNAVFSAIAMAQALGLIVLGLIGLGFATGKNLVYVRDEAATASARLGAAQAQLTQMTERIRPAERDKALEDAIKDAESRIQSSRQILDFVSKGDLGNSLGYAEFFRAFSRRAVPGVWITGFTLGEGGGSIEIQGRALQPAMVPSYIDALRHEPLFKGKTFGSLEVRAPAQSDAKESAKGKGAPELAFVEFTLKSSDATGGSQ